MIETWIDTHLLSKNKLISKKCTRSWFEKYQYLDVYDKIINVTSFLSNPSFPQRIWHIKNNLYTQFKCKNNKCNNFSNFLTFTSGYSETCSNRCGQLNPKTINKTKSKLTLFDDCLSEWQNMKNNGYDRIWDCGSIKFELKID